MTSHEDPPRPSEPSEPSEPLEPARPGADPADGGAPAPGTSPVDSPSPVDGAPPVYGTPPVYGAPADQAPPNGSTASPYGAPGHEPPAYGTPSYGPPPAYGAPPVYGASPTYGGAAEPPPYPYGGGPASAQSNNLGTWALVLGIVGVVLACACALPGLAAAIPAIILGNKGKAAAAQGFATNGSSAKAGAVLGWVAVGLAVLRFVTSLASGLSSYDFGS